MLKQRMFLAIMSLTLVHVVAMTRLCSGQQPTAQPQTIGIKVKIFDADNPRSVLVPQAAFGYYRPGPGQQPVFLNNLTFTAVQNEPDFYLVTVPKGILIERLVITMANSNFNAALLTKIVTANNMLIYPGASESTGTFNFQGFKGQHSAYRALFKEMVDDLGLTSAANMKNLFGKQLLAMPDAHDQVRLPGLDAEQRETARKLRKEVLILYGLLPPEPRQQIASPPKKKRRHCLLKHRSARR